MSTLLICHIQICSFNVITCCVSDEFTAGIVPGAFQKYWDWFFVGQKAAYRTGAVRKIDKGCSTKREKGPQYASGRWKNWNVRWVSVLFDVASSTSNASKVWSFEAKGVIHKEFLFTEETVTGQFYTAVLCRLKSRVRRARPEPPMIGSSIKTHRFRRRSSSARFWCDTRTQRCCKPHSLQFWCGSLWPNCSSLWNGIWNLM